jgi:acetyl-CoA carboxylase biotin carboxyl carrier protein
MDTKTLEEITKWMKQNDLSELIYKKDGVGMEIRTENAMPNCGLPQCTLVPLTSPAVGIYRAAKKGKSGNIEEGKYVKDGDKLGFIEMFKEKKPIVSTTSGYVKIVCVEDGKPAEFGQPLFFVEPASNETV